MTFFEVIDLVVNLAWINIGRIREKTKNNAVKSELSAKLKERTKIGEFEFELNESKKKIETLERDLVNSNERLSLIEEFFQKHRLDDLRHDTEARLAQLVRASC